MAASARFARRPYRTIQAAGRVADTEMEHVFNLGLGMLALHDIHVQLFRHGVQRPRQVREFIMASDVELARQMTLPKGGGPLVERHAPVVGPRVTASPGAEPRPPRTAAAELRVPWPTAR